MTKTDTRVADALELAQELAARPDLQREPEAARLVDRIIEVLEG